MYRFVASSTPSPADGPEYDAVRRECGWLDQTPTGGLAHLTYFDGDVNYNIDAIDNVRAKAAMAAHCRSQKQLLVMCGGAGGKRDPSRIRVDDLEAEQIVELLEREQLGFTRTSCDVPKLGVALFEPCLMSRHESPWIAVNRPPSTRCARVPTLGIYL